MKVSNPLTIAVASVALMASPRAVVEAAESITINYTDPSDGTALMGYLVEPMDTTSPKPAVLIIPDWDGVNGYEITRATMLADLGYVGFAADIFGLENHQPESFPERSALTSLYRNNLTLFAARIDAAIQYVESLPSVDPALGVAALGYCFGGTGVLNYAIGGFQGLDAVVAFHGGLGGAEDMLNKTIFPKVLIASGGEDSQDSTKSVMEMEEKLDAGNATWELSRYGPDVFHSFTKFDSSDYNERVDTRSWAATLSFLEEVFDELQGGSLSPDIPGVVTTEPVDYTDAVDGTSLQGHVSYPSVYEGQMLPAVLIVHDASGPDDYEKTRAQMLANMGYVGFAMDIWGDISDVDTSNRTERLALLNKYRDNIPLFVQRMNAGIDAAIATGRVDPNKIALIGYCFGGTGVIDYALVGETKAKAIVSFHGGLDKRAMGGATIYPKMMIQSGGEDDAGSQIEDLENAMEAGNATWEYSRYADVVHCFTDWFRDDPTSAGCRYNVRADVGSWESTTTFLTEVFAEEDSVAPTVAVAPTLAPVVVENDAPTLSPVVAEDDAPTLSPTETGSEGSGASGKSTILLSVVVSFVTFLSFSM